MQSQNQLSGSVPQENTLVSLIVLDLSRNQLSGSLPPLHGCEKLQVALFSHNRLSGSIPALPPMNQLGMKREHLHHYTSSCASLLMHRFMLWLASIYCLLPVKNCTVLLLRCNFWQSSICVGVRGQRQTKRKINTQTKTKTQRLLSLCVVAFVCVVDFL